MNLDDAVIVIAGAGGGAGSAVSTRLAATGATVVLAGNTAAALEPVAAEIAAAGGYSRSDVVDLLDETATQKWAGSLLEQYGRVDGLVHLVGGWRGGKGITEADLADWDWLSGLLVRTVQHTSRAFHDALLASPYGRFALVSAVEASRPTAKNASYAAAKAAAEAWTLALANSFKDSAAAATILVVKALVTPEMRAAKPESTFNGFTDVAELADVVAELWAKPTFDEGFTYLTYDAAEVLVSRRVRTIGIDYLSIERFGSKDFAVHKLLLGHGVPIIEGLDLRAIAAGSYTLVCLPVNLQGVDGAPARAILMQ